VSEVKIEPSSTTVEVGNSFTVRLTIRHAVDLGGFQFDMTYLASIVRVDAVALGDFLGSTGRATIPFGPHIDNQVGRVSSLPSASVASPGQVVMVPWLSST